MLIVCLGFVWPSHAGSATPVSTVSDHAASQVTDNNSLMPIAFSKQLAQSASFDRFFATAHGLEIADDVLLENAQNADGQASEQHHEAFNSTLFGPTKTELNALLKFDQTDLTDAIAANGHPPSSNNQHSNHDRSLDLAIAASSRFSSLLRHDPEEIQPAYQLAIELPVEPAASFAKDYRVDMHQTLDWTLKTSSPSGRISGWKESNLIYTVYHHRLTLA